MKRKVLVAMMIILSLVISACGDGNGTPPESTREVSTGGGGDSDTDENGVNLVTETPRLPVVIAVQNIPRGVIITPEHVRVTLYPFDQVPDETFTEIEFVVGQIAATDIYINELILSRKLVTSRADLGTVGSDAAALLEQGRVAVAVPIDRITSVAYAIQPGDRVDVIVSMLFVDIDPDFQTLLPNTMSTGGYFVGAESDPETGTVEFIREYAPPVLEANREAYSFRADGFETRTTTASDTVSITGLQTTTIRDDLTFPVVIEPSEQQRPRLVTQRTVTDAEVLYVGEFPADGHIFVATSTPVLTEESETASNAQDDGEEEPPPTANPRPTIITLAVRPQDAVVLTYMAEASIPMTFALRSARTQGLPDTLPVDLEFIVNEYGILEPPARLNYAIEPAIRSIRGITLENIFASGSPESEANVGNEGDGGNGG